MGGRAACQAWSASKRGNRRGDGAVNSRQAGSCTGFVARITTKEKKMVNKEKRKRRKRRDEEIPKRLLKNKINRTSRVWSSVCWLASAVR